MPNNRTYSTPKVIANTDRLKKLEERVYKTNEIKTEDEGKESLEAFKQLSDKVDGFYEALDVDVNKALNKAIESGHIMTELWGGLTTYSGGDVEYSFLCYKLPDRDNHYGRLFRVGSSGSYEETTMSGFVMANIRNLGNLGRPGIIIGEANIYVSGGITKTVHIQMPPQLHFTVIYAQINDETQEQFVASAKGKTNEIEIKMLSDTTGTYKASFIAFGSIINGIMG